MILPISGSCPKAQSQQLFIWFTVRLQRGLKSYFSSILGFILPYFVTLPLRVRNQAHGAGHVFIPEQVRWYIAFCKVPFNVHDLFKWRKLWIDENCPEFRFFAVNTNLKPSLALSYLRSTMGRTKRRTQKILKSKYCTHKHCYTQKAVLHQTVAWLSPPFPLQKDYNRTVQHLPLPFQSRVKEKCSNVSILTDSPLM